MHVSALQPIPPVPRDRPLRQSEGGIALIRRTIAGQTEWLVRWNDNWKSYFFVGGHRRADESFRDCVLREVREELGLAAATDFEVPPAPLADLRYIAFSQSAGVETAYRMQLFDVKLAESKAVERIDADTRNCWLTEREICRLETLDGRPISVTVPMLLTRAHLLDRT